MVNVILENQSTTSWEKKNSPIDSVRFRLGGILDVRFVQQILDAEQNLFDRDRRTPVLLFVEQRQTDRSRGVHVRVEQRRFELALWRAGWVVVLEDHSQLVETALPWGLRDKRGKCGVREGSLAFGRFPGNTYSLLSWNSAFPRHEIECAIGVFNWTSDESLEIIKTYLET